MQFVKVEALRPGMRLARPIYNKQGVLLFERDSKLTAQGIASIANFGLLGLFILEPAEPAPPMTEEDIEFERFQTVEVFKIQEELTNILNTKRSYKLQMIVSDIIRNYGHLDKKINLIQSLRSQEDFLYKHALNTAILCAMITHVMNVMLDEQSATIQAALVCDIGKLSLPPEMLDYRVSTSEIRKAMSTAVQNSYSLIEAALPDGTSVRRICRQGRQALEDLEAGQAPSIKMVTGAKILLVADMYDTLTAMNLSDIPVSEVAALRFMLDRPDTFDKEVIEALTKCIHILSEGVSVELNTGEKALVIRENENDILRPVVLSFADNSIIDLSDKELYGDIQIKDVMKTLDNRCIFNTEYLEKSGVSADKPEII